MTFTEHTRKSVDKLQIIFQILSGEDNTQWVNIGAGIWYVNFLNTYTFVDSSLLDYFSAQGFAEISGVTVDAIALVEATTLLEMSSLAGSFFYDGSTRSLYVRLTDSGEPFNHDIALGIVFGYSQNGFTPTGSAFAYEGRIIGIPQISKSRDPLFYGKIQFEGGSITLNNADGFFDSFIDENDIYGFESKILIGYDGLDITEYREVFTGFVENTQLTETSAEITLTDKRKQLSTPVTYACTALNALSAIKALILTSYSSIQYTDTFFDTTAWAEAEAQVQNVTITMQKPDAAINVIEGICASTFGLFLILPDGRFSFKVVNQDDDPNTIIPKTDIFNRMSFAFDSSQVLSSIRVGYNRNWVTTGNQYTYYTDTSRQASVFSQYKTYRQRDFDTYLVNSSAAAAFATQVLDYNVTISPVLEITTSLEYIDLELGDMIYAELDRPNADMFGIRKCEVTGISYNFESNSMNIKLRRTDDLLYYIGDDDGAIFTFDGYLWGASG